MIRRTPLAIVLSVAGIGTLTAYLFLGLFARTATAAEKRVRIRGRCNMCHPAAADEWKESAHRKAWDDPWFVKLSDGHKKAECLGCHAPDGIHLTGIGKEPEVRESVQSSGVDCAACHRDADDKSHGTQGRQSPDHEVVKDEKMGTVEMCGSCHAKHGTVAEFQASEFGKDPKACVTCHMPTVERPIAKDGKPGTAHVHSFKGTDNKELVQQGLELKAEAAGDELVVTLTSKRVGHKVPTGEQSKEVVLEVKLGDLTKTAVLSAAGDKDNRLAPGATFTFEVPTEGNKGKATVRVLHKSAHEQPEGEATVMLTAEVEI